MTTRMPKKMGKFQNPILYCFNLSLLLLLISIAISTVDEQFFYFAFLSLTFAVLLWMSCLISKYSSKSNWSFSSDNGK